MRPLREVGRGLPWPAFDKPLKEEAGGMLSVTYGKVRRLL